jgi:hypothetical protein
MAGPSIWANNVRETLATIAGLIVGFTATILAFRIQREAEMRKAAETSWIPWADRLLIGSGLIAVAFVIVPSVALKTISGGVDVVSRAACLASSIMLGGYIVAILAHYRLIWGRGRTGPRVNPEPAERGCVLATIALAVAGIIFVVVTR